MLDLRDVYRPSLGLLTDLYQLTMAYGYWQQEMAEHEAVFHLFFRQNPFAGGYTVAAGLDMAVSFLEHYGFTDEDVEYLARQTGGDGKPLFDPGFLEALRQLDFCCDVDAIPEGSVVFPQEPLVRVKGPLWQCQLLETPLLALINFQTLIATKAARITRLTGEEPVLEFGLRRAQGIDGGLSAVRGAYIGGAAATSNVWAGRLLDIPIKGTHAHSWVMSFDSELESFRAYAESLPNNCVFLVDTYDTLEGVRRAIEVGKWLREQGHEMVGVRLDSGDLAYLSREARQLLDQAGFPDARIVASNDLDEQVIESLKAQGARIDVWGIGTRLVTAQPDGALGGVYKLAAIRSGPEAEWQYRIKLSENSAKITNPGILQVRRYELDGSCLGDLIYSEDLDVQSATIVDPADSTRRKHLPSEATWRDLLQPLFRGGERVAERQPLPAIRDHFQADIARFHPAIKRLLNPHEYPVGLEPNLFCRKEALIRQARGIDQQETEQ